MKIICFSLLILLLISCDKEQEEPENLSGFTAGGKFYPTPYGSFENSGSTKDFSFSFTDKKIVKNSNGTYVFSGLASNTLNSLSITDLTLEAENTFVGDFFFDGSESLPLGIDDFGYLLAQEFDSNLNQVNPPPIYNVFNGSAKIKSKSGNYFDIEYEATFDNGVSIQGFYKGELVYIEN